MMQERKDALKKREQKYEDKLQKLGLINANNILRPSTPHESFLKNSTIVNLPLLPLRSVIRILLI
jgi:hypothetical protein